MAERLKGRAYPSLYAFMLRKRDFLLDYLRLFTGLRKRIVCKSTSDRSLSQHDMGWRITIVFRPIRARRNGLDVTLISKQARSIISLHSVFYDNLSVYLLAFFHRSILSLHNNREIGCFHRLIPINTQQRNLVACELWTCSGYIACSLLDVEFVVSVELSS